MAFAVCKVSIAPLRKENSDASEMVSQLLFGEVFDILEIQNNWTKILTLFDHYEGWIDSKHLLPLSDKETKRWLDGLGIERALIREIHTPWGKQTITRGAYVPASSELEFKIGNACFFFSNPEDEPRSGELTDFARSYLNSPYLWGGKSPFGIDCSGFVQQVFRLTDIKLPRDAYQQAETGREIEFSERQSGDLAFFHNSKGKITHVGLILEDLSVIHASGQVRIDELKADGIHHVESGYRTHELSHICRVMN